MAERRNRKKEQVHPKKNKGSTKAMVAAWGESSDEDSEDEDGDEKALMAIEESDEESEVSIIHLKDKIKFLSKKRLSELLLDFIDEFEDLNNEKEQLSKECVILKAKCKNLELRASERDSKNTELKNQVHELDTTVLELRSENLKLKLETGKKKVDHTHLTLEENVGKMKDELYKRDEQIRVIKEDLSKIKHELDITCKWNRSSDALSWLQEHHSSNKRELGYGTPAPKWDPKSKYITLLENKICTHCGKIGHYKKNELTCLSVLDNDPLLWHKRLGHASPSQLNKLVSKDLVIGLPNIKFQEDKVCEACARGKQLTFLSERQEHEDEAIGLVKGLNEVTAQAEAAPDKGTGDGTGSSIQGNLIGGTEQRRTESNSQVEPVHEPVPQQQNMGDILNRSQLVVRPYKYRSYHPIENIITDPTSGIKTRSQLKNMCAFDAFISLIEPKNVAEAMQDVDWVNAMQDELNQFERSQVWHLVPRPKDKSVIGTK
ncbi:uncharacterized protein [Nicotiana sylvestris]|uniref:uncharacterized protein n=1 Tax=Nicotiana sylvestris TaxID=4096 RepID=UPI00388C9EE3